MEIEFSHEEEGISYLFNQFAYLLFIWEQKNSAFRNTIWKTVEKPK